MWAKGLKRCSNTKFITPFDGGRIRKQRYSGRIGIGTISLIKIKAAVSIISSSPLCCKEKKTKPGSEIIKKGSMTCDGRQAVRCGSLFPTFSLRPPPPRAGDGAGVISSQRDPELFGGPSAGIREPGNSSPIGRQQKSWAMRKNPHFWWFVSKVNRRT